MAKKNGLIDQLGTLQDAIVLAKKAAGLKADAEVELLILPQPKSVFEQLFGDGAVAPDMESSMPDVVPPGPPGEGMAAPVRREDAAVDALPGPRAVRPA